MPQVFVATRNRKKLTEMQRLLSEHLDDVEVLGLDDVADYDEPVEDAADFAGNALIKARAGVAATGLPTLADDSGLCVDALNGMPGVLSARWAGPPKDDDRNNRLLLDQLADVPDDRRGAGFRCAIAFCRPDGAPVLVDGSMRGVVLRETRGTEGFGYDVLFVPDEHRVERGGDGRTSAELSAAEKDALSHRGAALREIAPVVASVLG